MKFGGILINKDTENAKVLVIVYRIKYIYIYYIKPEKQLKIS